MEDISSKIIQNTIDTIVAKKKQDPQLSNQLNLWLSALISGSEDIDNKEDAWDRIETILNTIEV